MHQPCLDPTCPWHLESGHLFCGLCSTPAVKLGVEPMDVLDGIVFYPRSDGDDSSTFLLSADGGVALPVDLSVSPHYELAIANGHSGSRLSLTLSPLSAPTPITLRRRTDLPPDALLKIESGVQSLTIPVHKSDTPVFRLADSGTKGSADRGGILRLYPEGQNLSWSLELRLLRGTAIVTELLIEGAPGLEVTPASSLPTLVRHGSTLPVTLAWTGPTQGTRHCQLVPVTRRGREKPLALEVHARRPTILKHRVVSPSGDTPLFFGGDTDQTIQIALMNEGAALTTLESWDVRLSEGWLESVELVPADDPDAAEKITSMRVHGGVPHPRVRAAIIPIRHTGGDRVQSDVPLPDDAELIRSLTFAVSPQFQPSEGFVEFPALLRVRANERTEESTIIVSHQAKAIGVANERLELLIDYGTVHTCAYVHSPSGAIGEGATGLVALNSLEEAEAGGTAEEMKSAYRVKDWNGRKFGFGLDAWAGMAQYISSTDFASKLRLGRAQKRFLRDEIGVIRGVSGKQAAVIVLGDVLRRVRDRQGLEFQRIRLTHPAAFERGATDELRGALVELGFRDDSISFPCSEPEAFLYSLGQDEDLIKALRKRYDDQTRNGKPVLGIVFDFGGGTTDVTVFEFEARKGRPKLHVIASHGYDWLGGERVTEFMAGELLRTVEDHERFPFPDLGSPERADQAENRGLRGHTLNPNRPEEQANYGALRDAAEAAKCDPSNRGEGSVRLVDEEAQSHLVDIQKREGDDDTGLRGVVTQMVQLALEDIDRRLFAMETHGVIEDIYPECVAVAGNSGRLWCLEQVIKDHLSHQDLIYRFDRATAKTGVLHGLKDYKEQPLVPVVSNVAGRGIRPRPRTLGWWFVLAQGRYHLALPAGVLLDEAIDPEQLLDALPAPILLTGPVKVGFGQEPGPQGGIGSHEARKRALRPSGEVALPSGIEPGVYCRLRMGCDEGQVGLWFQADEDDHPHAFEWLWSPLPGAGGTAGGGP